MTADREATVAGGAEGEQTTEHTDTDKSAKPTDKAETSESSRRKTRSTLSISRMKEERKRAKIKEQERRWAEATATSLGEIPAGELDLEGAMISPDEDDKQQTLGKDKMDEEEGYGKIYTKTHEKKQNEVYQDWKEENRRKNVRGKRPHERKLRKKQTGWLKKRLNAISKGHSWRKRNGRCRKG